MFDTMTGVKVVGGFCGALLLFLLGGWAAEGIYHIGGGHGGEQHQAYTIPVEEGEGAAEEEGEAVPFEEVFAEADAGAGERLFRQCSACHRLDGSDGVGPHLDGVVGRPIGAVDGYAYSPAMAEHGDDWTPENLNLFIEDPSGYIGGTKMTYSGMDSVENRANLIAYLQNAEG